MPRKGTREELRVTEREYMREYRDLHPEKQRANQRKQSARGKAMRQLVKLHKTEFDLLYLAQLRALMVKEGKK